MPFVHNFSGLLIAIIIPICLIFVQYVHAYTCYAFKKKKHKEMVEFNGILLHCVVYDVVAFLYIFSVCPKTEKSEKIHYIFCYR